MLNGRSQSLQSLRPLDLQVLTCLKDMSRHDHQRLGVGVLENLAPGDGIRQAQVQSRMQIKALMSNLRLWKTTLP